MGSDCMRFRVRVGRTGCNPCEVIRWSAKDAQGFRPVLWKATRSAGAKAILLSSAPEGPAFVAQAEALCALRV